MTNSTALADSGNNILRPRMPELDSVRGLAILGVFLYHTLYTQRDLSNWSKPFRLFLTATWPGHFGVNLFFVLSGFLITGILVDSRSEPRYYGRFYKRRALRILPAYFGVVAILAITKLVPTLFLLSSVFYLANFAPMFGIPRGYPVLWSLSVEEHFYFLWPVFCRRFTDKALAWVCLGIVALSPISRYISLLFTARGGMAFHSFEYTWNSLDGLACGALLALSLRNYQLTRTRFVRCCCGLLVLAIISWFCLMPFGILSRETGAGAALQISILNLAFTGLLGLFLYLGSGGYAHLVQIKPLQFLGYISYGLYLIHDFFIRMYDRVMANSGFTVHGSSPVSAVLTRMVVAGCLSLAAAYISRAFYEEYFLRFKGT